MAKTNQMWFFYDWPPKVIYIPTPLDCLFLFLSSFLFLKNLRGQLPPLSPTGDYGPVVGTWG